MEYILYCDESTSRDIKYSDFFGGCIIRSSDYLQVVSELEKCKQKNHLMNEIKWTKVSEQYLDKYIEVVKLFFSFVREGKIKVRIMFRKTDTQYVSLSKSEKYFKLYYQFIKHAFGFTHTQNMEPFKLRIYLDQLPTRKEDCSNFKQFLKEMPNTADFNGCALRILPDQIAEISSHEHILLQCVDIVMGAMQFRLNLHHLDKPVGQFRRGKKTIAKEKLYNVINKEIQTIHPCFNIGISTGSREYSNPHWESPYEHWLFVPNHLR